MYALNVIVFVLLVIGGLNWGLVGLANFNLVEKIFAGAPVIAKIIYIIVGLAAIYAIVFYNYYIRHPSDYGEHEPHEHAGHTPHMT
jgi:uncharacterized membrane protein YuzA (DUF378 family)